MSAAAGGLAGRLAQRIVLERPDTTRDAIGGASGGWIAAGTAAAALVPLGGDRWRATLRAPSPVAVGWRIGWRGAWLAVTEAIADPRTPDRVALTVEAQARAGETGA